MRIVEWASNQTRGLTTYIGEEEFLIVIHRGDGNLALRHVMVVVDVVGQKTHFCGYMERQTVFHDNCTESIDMFGRSWSHSDIGMEIRH